MSLLLQGPEEALDDRVVPAVATTAEAALDAGVLQRSLVGVARVLRAAVGMLEQPRLGKSLTDGPGQCRHSTMSVCMLGCIVGQEGSTLLVTLNGLRLLTCLVVFGPVET